MKKFLLTLTLAFSLQGINAQVLTTENCTALTIGDVGTDLTGMTAGQGGWLTYVAAAAAAPTTDFQVVSTTDNGNAFQITGSNTATNTRYLFKDLSTDWTSRTTGNDIFEAEFDFYTGPVTTSLNSMQTLIYDGTGTKLLGGISVKKSTLVVSGLSNYNNAGTIGNYSFGMGASSTAPIVLNPDSWYRFGFSYNYTTGVVKFKAADAMGTILFNNFVNGAAPTTDITEIDFVASAGTGNALSSTGIFDNLTVKAVSVDGLLGTEQHSILDANFSVYPNPAKELISISNPKNILINGIKIVDVNGRVVKQIDVKNIANTQINVSDLTSGIYFMTINSDQGTVTKKIIKN